MRVKLDSKLDETGVRKVSIKTKRYENKIYGPIRVVNNTELGYLTELKSRGVYNLNYDADIIEIRKTFSDKDLKELESNLAFKNFKKQRAQINRLTPKNDSLKLFRAHTELNQKTGLPIGASDKTNEILIEMGIFHAFDFISIYEPFISSNINSYEKRMVSSREYILAAENLNRREFIPVPVIDCRNVPLDIVEARAKCLLNNNFNIANVICGGNRDNILQLRRIQKVFLDKDVFLFGTDIPKKIGRKNPVSGIHFFQIYGLNALSTSIPKPIFPPKRTSLHDIPLSSIKRFYRYDGDFISRGDHQLRNGEDLKCDCPVCAKQTLTEFYEQGSNKKGLIALKSKIHEVYSSSKEFSESNKFYGEMKEYFRSRKALAPLVFSETQQQSNLSDF